MDDVFSDRIDRARLAELNRQSDGRGLLRLAGHVAALLLTGCILSRALGTWWVAPATLLHGAVLVFLFAPLHESIHRTAFKSRALNDAVGWVCGALLLLPPEYFRFFHFAHHRHTQDPANDPELAAPKPANPGQWLVHVSGWLYWRARVWGTLMHAAGRITEPFLSAPRAAERVVREARQLLLLYLAIAAAALLFGTWWPLIYWVIPALAGQPLLRIYLLAEHGLCPLVPDMLANSRTTRSNAIVRFFVWNMPYHAEHHAYPSVPFHALPEVHRAIAGDIKVTAPGYIAVQRQLLRSFRVPSSR
ncbi:MAG: fatty acid desaturase [Dongiaceae bacterium]